MVWERDIHSKPWRACTRAEAWQERSGREALPCWDCAPCGRDWARPLVKTRQALREGVGREGLGVCSTPNSNWSLSPSWPTSFLIPVFPIFSPVLLRRWGVSKRLAGILGASWDHPTTLRHQTVWTNGESCAGNQELQHPWKPQWKAAAPGAHWALNSARTALQAHPAASYFFMRKHLLGSAMFLPTHLTSILGQKAQYSKASLKNCWVLLCDSNDSVYCQ